MCQMNAVIEQDGKVDLIRESVTRLDVLTQGVRLSSLFDGTMDLPDMVIDHIDFLTGKLYLRRL